MFTPFNSLFVITPLLILVGMWFLGGFTLIYAVAFVWLMLYSLRLVFRHQVIQTFRRSRMGDVVWFQVKPNSRKLPGTPVDRSKAQVSAVHSTLSRLTEPTVGSYLNRGVVYLVWAKRPPKNDEDTVRLTGYIGISRASIEGAEGVLQGMADKIGAEIRRLRGQPDFPVREFVFAKEETYSTAVVTDGAQTTLQPVSERLLHDENFVGHVVMAVEYARRSEKARLTSHINELGARDAGDTKQHSGIAARSVDLFVNSVYRTSLAVSSAQAGSRPDGVLSMITNTMTESGVVARSCNPATDNNRRTAIYSALFVALCVGGMYVPFLGVSNTLLIAFAVCSGVLFVASAANIGFLGHDQLKNGLRHGVIAVPGYTWWSLRWRYMGLINYYRLMANGDELSRNRTANPSANQVLHYHKTPLASYIAMPPQNPSSDVEKEELPEVGVRKDYESQFRDGDLFMGVAGKSQACYLPLDRLQFQLFALGGAGSGKSNFMQVLYTNAAYNSVHRTDGLKVTPIWGESKGNGAYEAWDLVKDYKRSLFIDCNNPKSRIRIALEGPRLGEKVGNRITGVEDVIRSTNHLTDMFKYMWRDDIKASSEQYLRFSLRIASLLNEEEIRDVLELSGAVDPAKPNLIELAYILLGNDPRFPGIPQRLGILRDEFDNAKKGTREAYLVEAIITIGDTSSRERKPMVMAPSNKFSKMREVRWLWEPKPGVHDVYIRSIIAHGAPVVINTGAYQGRDPDTGELMTYPGVGTELSEDALKGITYSIWSDVKRYGASWEAKGIRVPVFFDEVSHVAHDYHGRDVITEGINEGRSFGFGLVTATQNLGRVEDGVAKQMLNMPTKIFFRQESTDNVDVVMNEIGGDVVYSRQNVRDLSRGNALALVGTSEGTVGPFTLHTPYAPEWKEYLTEHGSIEHAARAYVSDHRSDEGDVW